MTSLLIGPPTSAQNCHRELRRDLVRLRAKRSGETSPQPWRRRAGALAEAGPRALGCLAVLVVMLCAAPTGSLRAQAPDVGTEAQRESGKRLYLKYLFAVPR